MKSRTIYFCGVLTIISALNIGCMDREPASVCPVPTELKKTDPGLTEFDGVDILVVVDNSSSMDQEQDILATSFFPLINSLVNPLPGSDFDGTDNIRIAITTSDMGVSYDGKAYDGWETFLSHLDTNCRDAEKGAMGDNGAFVDDYNSEKGAQVEIQEGVIPCAEDRHCPPNWRCENIGNDNLGKCFAPAGEGNLVQCPPSPKDRNTDFVNDDWDNKALSVACLAKVGIDGCNYEQQLAAAAAGISQTLDNDGRNSSFLRERKVTTIIIVSDEEDCSLKSNEWHSLDELGGVGANVACGSHPEYLLSISDLKLKYDEMVEGIVGKTTGIVFAAIVGVPYNQESAHENTDCEGRGTQLAHCKDVEPRENGTGTMANPEVVERSNQEYFEYACRRFEEGKSAENGDRGITEAYPGMRYVEMAQEYGDNGYVYSICHDDWSPAMESIAEMISENLGGSCFEKRLNWDPESEKAGCNVVFEYRAPRDEDAPECPDDKEQKWLDDGELTVDAGTGEWVRACSVAKLAAPIDCDEMNARGLTSDYMRNEFGWFYCENPGENNMVACNDNLDNDRDGLKDGDDPDCDACLKGGICSENVCPYKVSLTDRALEEAAQARVKNRDVVCLQQYRFEDPNCKESTRDACNDGEDNDGNGPFDCWSYAKGETIDEDHFPDSGARNADPDCCPMRVSTEGMCQFVDYRGNDINLSRDPEDAAYVETCNVKTGAKAIPDACCEAARALLCRLPDDFRNECTDRGL